ncbi:MAG: single-stranded DNA-binding protein [Clostridiales bacterium]|nr:single-stranded DNA-binding protein [Clostridiales bacterium]
MNSVNFIGRLTHEPDVKKTGNGLSVCDLRFAIDDTYSKDDRSDFINVTVFGNQAEVCKRYLRKGFLAGVSGRIRSEAYTGQDGIKRYPVKVVADRIQFLQWPDRTESKPQIPAFGENGDPELSLESALESVLESAPESALGIAPEISPEAMPGILEDDDFSQSFAEQA